MARIQEWQPPNQDHGSPENNPQRHGDAKTRRRDQWLECFHIGEIRPQWLDEAASPLMKMLQSESDEERVTAARVLVPLGRSNKAIEVLESVVRTPQGLQLATAVAGVLRWLPTDRKIAAVLRLTEAATGPRVEFVAELEYGSDLRVRQALWKLLAHEGISKDSAEIIWRRLKHSYVSVKGMEPTANKSIREIQSHAATGGELHRLVALLLLARADENVAVDVARKWIADQNLPESLRADAYQLILNLEHSLDQSRVLALELLRGDTLAFRKVAVRFLAGGVDETSDFRGTFNTHFHSSRFVGGGGPGRDAVTDAMWHAVRKWRPIVPAPPWGLVLDDFRDLLHDPDPRTASLAKYLAALLGDADALRALVQSWQTNNTPSRWYVYRAIALMDDPQYVPVLRKIYEKSYKKRPGYARGFYWTIRIMSGPEVLELRKQIRDDAGGVHKL
jgi:HEAT repeat protein